jgi:hypothetical protein
MKVSVIKKKEDRRMIATYARMGRGKNIFSWFLYIHLKTVWTVVV